MDGISPSAPVNTNYSQYAPVPVDLENHNSDITSLFGIEVLKREGSAIANKSSVVPEKYRKPTNVTQQRRINACYGTRKCYTCFPKRLAQEHTILYDSKAQVKFHFDMCNRPLLIATPVKHINTVAEFNTEELKEFFDGISEFCNFWNIKDYQIQINHGKWQNHEHLHAKIKANEDLIYNMRQNHFKLIKLQKERKINESAENTDVLNS